jgi:hypothetical protein
VIHPDFPDYDVTPDGRVFRITATSPFHPPRELTGCVRADGYREFGLCNSGGVHRLILANRLVCEAFHGRPPSEKHEAAHWDGDKLNNYFTNLRWATRKENEDDKLRHGTHQQDKPPFAKLTEQDVHDIRAIPGHISHVAVAKRYGIHAFHAGRIRRGQCWKRLLASRGGA